LLVHHHRLLFQWHCRKFFRFRRHLSCTEKDYLEACFALAGWLPEVSETGYSHFSTYSYSHRVEGERVNSSRLAYGSVSRPEEAWQAARPVVAERGLHLPEFCLKSPVSRFYGLGWDILERQFKVYFRVLRLAEAPLELLQGQSLPGHREEGLLSFTYTDGLLSESKVYLYPLDTPGEARMVSDRRGVVAQHDVQPAQRWELNNLGQSIVALYKEFGEELDTITYQDSDNFTLYFP
jgi:hypothetical protein